MGLQNQIPSSYGSHQKWPRILKLPVPPCNISNTYSMRRIECQFGELMITEPNQPLQTIFLVGNRLCYWQSTVEREK